MTRRRESDAAVMLAAVVVFEAILAVAVAVALIAASGTGLRPW